MKFFLAGFFLLCGITLQTVWAQKLPSQTEINTARQYYQQAEAFEQKGNYSASVPLFNQASVLFQKNKKWAEKIDCDNKLSRSLYLVGKYPEALEKANQTLKEIFTKQPIDSSKAISTYITLGHVHLIKAEYPQALNYQQKALLLRIATLGQLHPDVADSYNLIGNIYFGQGEYPKALEYHQKSLKVRRATLNETHLGIGNSYYYIGNVYFITGQYDKGLEYHLKGLQIRKAALGEIHLDVGNSLNSIGNNYHYKGEYDKALEYHQKALHIRRTLFGENHPSVAGSYNNIGNVYHLTGEFDKALEYHQKGLQIRLVVFGEQHLDVADSYHVFGNLYSEKGDYDKALEYYQKSLQIRSSILPEMHPGRASSHQTIGSIYLIKGESSKALEYYQKALQIRRVALGESHPHVATSYNDIGNVFELRKDYKTALEYHLKALQIKCSGLGEKHPKVADAYYNLGNVYLMQGDYETALDYHQMALLIRRSVFGENHPSIGESYTQHGILYLAKKDYAKAAAYHNQALHHFLKIFGTSHPSVADSYNQLGKVYAQQGQLRKALQLYQQAIIANVPAFQDTLVARNPILAGQTKPYLTSKTLLVSLRTKAKVLETSFNQSHDTTDLLVAYQTACLTDSLANKIQRNQESESDKVAFNASTVELYQQALPLCLKLYNLTRQQTYLDKAFYFAERGKSSVLLSSLLESKAKIFAGIPDSLLQQDQNLRSQLAQYTQHLAKELNKGTEADSAKLISYQNQLFNAHRQKEKLVNQFEEFYPRYYDLKYQAAVVSPQQLQEKLTDRTVVLEYALSPDALQVFMLGNHFFEVKSIPIDSLFERQLDAFRDAIVLKDADLYRQVAYKLYRILIPSSIPANTKSLIIIPDGKLNLFPFEALLTQAGKVKLNRSGAYLLHKYNVSYAYSGRLLYERLMQTKETTAKHLLALAPVFADSMLSHSAATSKIKLGSKQHYALHQEITRIGTQIAEEQPIMPLLASEGEVETIGQLFRAKGARAQVYLYQKATEDHLKSPDISQYNYLHLATHGFVNQTFPELSGLMLAQNNPGPEDGILYTGEIYNLHLNADLVTLSACETGLGKLAQGEGVIGLSRALLFAGAKNIVVSLWKVSDESTANLMKYFYQALLAGKDKATALQIAKRKLINHSSYRSPFYWAPFILIGK
ncbi:CHAT domain-containing protein [Adhaeribacter swui]|uniref:CHAT domain-containing protein n=1 Tax=Adhaeribacter swui TaxID=2086471 RepID=A0A7G7GER6_9BACT|nr:CHAT domain-containing tetratricopeptide repeat protein [Adhaeribacter swui]QNF35650.1 CHAT domain-containing protein [Adhaeribacter swui]